MSIHLSGLRFREPAKPPIMVVYGPGGVGKTTLAVGSPAPVVLAVESGLAALEVPHWPITSYAEVIEAIGVLYAEEHELKTLVIDSLDWLEPLVWAEACRLGGWKEIEEPGYGKGYVKALDLWRDVIGGLKALRDERGMGIILIAHNVIKRYEDPTGEPFDRQQLKLHEKTGGLITEAVDVVAFEDFRRATVKTDVGYGRKVTRGVGGGQRVLYTEARPGFLAKSRFAMPASIDLPDSKDPATLWSAFAQHLPSAAATPAPDGYAGVFAALASPALARNETKAPVEMAEDDIPF